MATVIESRPATVRRSVGDTVRLSGVACEIVDGQVDGDGDFVYEVERA